MMPNLGHFKPGLLGWFQISLVILLMSARPSVQQASCFFQRLAYMNRDCYNNRQDLTCQVLLGRLKSSCGFRLCDEDGEASDSCFLSDCPSNFTYTDKALCGRGHQCCSPTFTSCEDFPLDSEVPVVRIQHELGFEVVCDYNWTVIQWRTSGGQSFDMPYADYEMGFGGIQQGYWLGLFFVRSLLDRGTHEIRFEFNLADGTHFEVQYYAFDIANATDGYRLNISSDNYNINASSADGSDIEELSGMQFTTKDKDQDGCRLCNCAVPGKGGWWWNSCGRANLNGRWGFRFFNWGPIWLSESRNTGPLSFTAMKIRLAE